MTWFILASALLALNFQQKMALWILLIAIIVGVFENVLALPALTFVWFIILLATISHCFNHNKIVRVITNSALFLSAIALMLHIPAGFNNLRYIHNEVLGPNSAPFTFYLNFDKALIPFVLLACIPTLFKTSALYKANKIQWILLILSLPLLLLTAVLAGGLSFELHLPFWLPVFIATQLFFVCLAEEALFRGCIQQYLSSILPPYVALVITALLFGLSHFSGGLMLMIFATFAGVIYGLAWMWSGKLWIATLFHFGLNLLHLLFFTYPFKISNYAQSINAVLS